jgi:NTP pyrophosphatase (non-canonical NTP hydrolase)
MRANEYQYEALRTAVSPTSPEAAPGERLLNAALGIGGEAGEIANVWTVMKGSAAPHAQYVLLMTELNGWIADHLKKAIFHGHKLDYHGINERIEAWIRAANTLQRLLADPERELLSGDPFPHGLPNISNELGDVQWYIALASTAIGTTIADVMEQNIAKLRRRYPDGFSAQASQERAE